VVVRSNTGEGEASNISKALVNADPTLVIESESVTHTPTCNVTQTIIAYGATRMLLANTPDFAGASWEPFAATKAWQLTTGSGAKTVYLRVVYAYGDTSRIVIDQIEAAPLNPSVVIAGGAAQTASRNIALRVSAVGGKQLQVSNSAFTGNEQWIPYADSLQWELAAGVGTKTVHVKVRNDFLIEAEASDQIDPAPLNPSVVIAGGAVQTATRNINLRLWAVGATQMQVSNDPFTGDEQWIPFADSLQWQLATGTGTKTVYIKVRNDFLIEAEASDQIDPALLNPSVVIDGGVAQTASRNVVLRVSAVGGTQLQVSNSPFTGGEQWIPYSDSLQWELEAGVGTKTVHAKVRNDFLIEAEASDQINPAPLNSSLQIIPDSTYINHLDITLSMPNIGALEMKIVNNADSGSARWQPYQAQLNWNLTAGDGWKQVYAWFRNDFFSAGPVMDSVGLDTRASIRSFDWTATGGDTLLTGDQVVFVIGAANDAFGAETDGTCSVTVEGWQPITLTDQRDGTYDGIYVITDHTPGVVNARVTTSFIDRAGNQVPSIASGRRITRTWLAGTEREFALGNTGLTIKMCWIPAGTFYMGSPDDEFEHYPDESPVHQVTFPNGFWISKYEVTQQQWTSLMVWNPLETRGVGALYPIYSVSWDDIQEFENRLNNEFRLPSESEWEYACRAGTRTLFFWGEEIGMAYQYAWLFGNSGNWTHQVGELLPNGWGLCDINGNVSEWCEDWYHSNYDGAPTDGNAWIAPPGEYRVLRGGAWPHNYSNCRSARRAGNHSDGYGVGIGFRLVLDND